MCQRQIYTCPKGINKSIKNMLDFINYVKLIWVNMLKMNWLCKNMLDLSEYVIKGLRVVRHVPLIVFNWHSANFEDFVNCSCFNITCFHFLHFFLTYYFTKNYNNNKNIFACFLIIFLWSGAANSRNKLLHDKNHGLVNLGCRVKTFKHVLCMRHFCTTFVSFKTVQATVNE